MSPPPFFYGDIMTTKQILSQIKKAALGTALLKNRNVPVYDRVRATKAVRFALGIATHYAKHLDLSVNETLAAMERVRTYSALNYYQSAKFPRLDNSKIHIYKTYDDFRAAFPRRLYICPACNGTSTHPQTCNSGVIRDGKICDWKSFGLLGCLGKGFTFIIKEQIKDEGIVIHDIFMPIEMYSTEK